MNQSEKLADNVVLIVWSRISMAVTPPILVLMATLGMAWMDNRFANADEVQLVKDRVTSIEITITRGREMRDIQQKEMMDTIKGMTAQLSVLSNNVAALTAKIETQEKFLNGRR